MKFFNFNFFDIEFSNYYLRSKNIKGIKVVNITLIIVFFFCIIWFFLFFMKSIILNCINLFINIKNYVNNIQFLLYENKVMNFHMIHIKKNKVSKIYEHKFFQKRFNSTSPLNVENSNIDEFKKTGIQNFKIENSQISNLEKFMQHPQIVMLGKDKRSDSWIIFFLNFTSQKKTLGKKNRLLGKKRNLENSYIAINETKTLIITKENKEGIIKQLMLYKPIDLNKFFFIENGSQNKFKLNLIDDLKIRTFKDFGLEVDIEDKDINLFEFIQKIKDIKTD